MSDGPPQAGYGNPDQGGHDQPQPHYPHQGVPQQGYPQQQAAPQQGGPQQSYPQGVPQQGYPPQQGAPQQGYPPQQGFPPQPGVPQQGYPPHAQPVTQQGFGQAPPGGGSGPGTPPGEPKKRRTGLIIGAIVLVLALVGAGLAFGLRGSSDDTASEGGEVFLTAADDAGPGSFSPTPFAPAPDPAPAPLDANATRVAASSAPITATGAATPGLYGGTMNQAACDADAMVQFLAANQDKAQAWVEGMNQDPNVVLPDGSKLTAATIPQYVATLTAVVLHADTRVTNHGCENGRVTTMQSVLQKGTAVLVDDYGVPRVKCYCGNPLQGPRPPRAPRSTPAGRGRASTPRPSTSCSAPRRSSTSSC